MATQTGFSAGQSAKVVGLPYRTLDHWAKTKFIEPSLGKAEGTGTARKYSFNDLVALKVAKKLRSAGISLQGLRPVATFLRKHRAYTSPLSDAFLISTADGDVVEKTQEEVISLLKNPGQRLFLWILDLAEVVNNLQGSVRVVEKPRRGPASQVA